MFEYSVMVSDFVNEIIDVFMNIKFEVERKFDEILFYGSADTLREIVHKQTEGLNDNEVDEICNVLTKVEKNEI